MKRTELDKIAIKVMGKILKGAGLYEYGSADIAQKCYQVAEEMIKEKEKRETPTV